MGAARSGRSYGILIGLFAVVLAGAFDQGDRTGQRTPVTGGQVSGKIGDVLHGCPGGSLLICHRSGLDDNGRWFAYVGRDVQWKER